MCGEITAGMRLLRHAESLCAGELYYDFVSAAQKREAEKSKAAEL